MESPIRKPQKNKWLGFSQKNFSERIDTLEENGYLNAEFSEILKNNINLPREIANQMTENSIGTFALPFSVAPHFLIDGKEYVIPMVTEEPSVVAASSYAAKLIGKSGGFFTKIHDRKMTGQVILYNIENISEAVDSIRRHEGEILCKANDSYPSIVARGGGAKKIHTEYFSDGGSYFLSVYLTVDVQEAMGANIINTMLEGIRPLLEKITGSEGLMSILSNYATESLVTSKCKVNIKYLSNNLKEASNIAEKIEFASVYAKLDIYRAATHNKGIFNGIDAIAIATGNDWRAIDAGGHAFASRNGKYEGLTTWHFDRKNGLLVGEITLPMPIAAVGGSIGLNPTVKSAFNLLCNPDAKTLASIVVSVGLAQNFAALKALVSTGIQKGHMKLQARSLALLAGADKDEVSHVTEMLLLEKHMNLSAAENILKKLRNI